MARWKLLIFPIVGLTAVAIAYGVFVVRRGFSTLAEPSFPERVVARTIRNLSIPSRSARETNPWKLTRENLQDARDTFVARCAICHGNDGTGQTTVGRSLYPKPPNLLLRQTQDLTDGQIHYIIQNGVRLTGMPAWGNPHEEMDDVSWKLVLFIRDLRRPTGQEISEQLVTVNSGHYIGSKACEKCHAELYARWKKTPMANVVRDPREHPEAIIPDLSKNPLAKFTKEQVAFV